MSKQQVDDLLLTAIQIQQKLYELSGNWTVYENNQHIRLKQNIAYAIFGPPMSNDLSIDELMNGSELSTYPRDALKTVETVYTKIVKIGRNANTTEDICCTVIFNVIFCCDQNSKTRDATSSQLTPIPIFKVQKYSKGSCNIAFIDSSGRIYKDWNDYKRNNNLPKCSMILPIEGIYQADPTTHCNENFSTVWIENLPSPASKVKSKVLKAGDLAAGLVGVGGMGVTMAAMFTPIGAMVGVAGLAACTINGAWTASRCIEKLVDREKHGQSINITNKEACAEWLGIAGSALGVAASGGSVAISKAVTAGKEVAATARIAFNTVNIGNMIVNGASIGFSTYCIVDNFLETGKIRSQDMLLLSSHILFFGNSVINAKTAKGLIESTQRNYIREYELSLRTNRLKSEFARMKRQIGSNSLLIRKINMVRVQDDLIGKTTPKTQEMVVSTAVGLASSVLGNANIQKMLVSDSLKFAVQLVKKWLCKDLDYKNMDTGDPLFRILNGKLVQLVVKFWTVVRPALRDVSIILYDMRHVTDSSNTLEKVFLICVGLVTRNSSFEKYIDELFQFVWEYAKEKASEFLTASKSVDDVRRDEVVKMFNFLDPLAHALATEFRQYLSVKLCFTKLRPSCS